MAGEEIRWLEYRQSHLGLHTFSQFSNVSRNMAIILLRLNRKTISFKVHRHSEVGADWFQYLYSTSSPVMMIDLIILRTCFSETSFLAE